MATRSAKRRRGEAWPTSVHQPAQSQAQWRASIIELRSRQSVL